MSFFVRRASFLFNDAKVSTRVEEQFCRAVRMTYISPFFRGCEWEWIRKVINYIAALLFQGNIIISWRYYTLIKKITSCRRSTIAGLSVECNNYLTNVKSSHSRGWFSVILQLNVDLNQLKTIWFIYLNIRNASDTYVGARKYFA